MNDTHFKYFRHIICLDACHLKGLHRGKLFAATCLDAKNEILISGFGVLDQEDTRKWNKISGISNSQIWNCYL